MENEKDPLTNYKDLLNLPRSEVTLYELAHPPHNSEEEYGQIMGVWEYERQGWSRVWKEALPQPKRRIGRPPSKKTGQGQDGPKKKFAMWLNLGLTDEIVAGLAAVRGDLPFDECIRQLLTHALGSLVPEKKISSQ